MLGLLKIKEMFNRNVNLLTCLVTIEVDLIELFLNIL